MKTPALHVLAVDDDPTIRYATVSVLIRLGHTVEAVEDGSEAIDLFNAKPHDFQVVITDYSMPRADGLTWSPICAIAVSREKSWSCPARSRTN